MPCPSLAGCLSCACKGLRQSAVGRRARTPTKDVQGVLEVHTKSRFQQHSHRGAARQLTSNEQRQRNTIRNRRVESGRCGLPTSATVFNHTYPLQESLQTRRPPRGARWSSGRSARAWPRRPWCRPWELLMPWRAMVERERGARVWLALWSEWKITAVAEVDSLSPRVRKQPICCVYVMGRSRYQGLIQRGRRELSLESSRWAVVVAADPRRRWGGG